MPSSGEKVAYAIAGGAVGALVGWVLARRAQRARYGSSSHASAETADDALGSRVRWTVRLSEHLPQYIGDGVGDKRRERADEKQVCVQAGDTTAAVESVLRAAFRLPGDRPLALRPLRAGAGDGASRAGAADVVSASASAAPDGSLVELVVGAAPVPRAPVTTAAAWGIADPASGRLLLSHNAGAKLQPASLTKIVTALVVLRCAEKDPEGLERQIEVSKAAADCKRGTHAELKQGEKYKAGQLLYGLMLPSGNDAAVAFAEHYGVELDPPADGATLPDGRFYDGAWTAESPVGRFVAEMNRVAAELGPSRGASTRFVNPHGMGHVENLSCVGDIAACAAAAMRYEVFRTVVARYVHKTTVMGKFRPRTVRWQNTNELLQSKGNVYSGVKTGWVPVRKASGNGDRIHGCLVTVAEQGQREQQHGIGGAGDGPPSGDGSETAGDSGAAAASETRDSTVSTPRNPSGADGPPTRILAVVLGSRNKVMRFVDTDRIVSWAWAALAAGAAQ